MKVRGLSLIEVVTFLCLALPSLHPGLFNLCKLFKPGQLYVCMLSPSVAESAVVLVSCDFMYLLHRVHAQPLYSCQGLATIRQALTNPRANGTPRVSTKVFPLFSPEGVGREEVLTGLGS